MKPLGSFKHKWRRCWLYGSNTQQDEEKKKKKKLVHDIRRHAYFWDSNCSTMLLHLGIVKELWSNRQVPRDARRCLIAKCTFPCVLSVFSETQAGWLCWYKTRLPWTWTEEVEWLRSTKLRRKTVASLPRSSFPAHVPLDGALQRASVSSRTRKAAYCAFLRRGWCFGESLC